MTLFEEIVSRGIPYANHESDLYIPATDETRALVKQCRHSTPSAFVNEVEGGLWLDVPFAYDPWWQRRVQRPKPDAPGYNA